MNLIPFVMCFYLSTTGQESQQVAFNVQMPASELWMKAQAAYDTGDFAQASDLYETLTKSQPSNGYIYYNLANAYYRQDFLGKAIANYLRARQLLPRNPEIKANLNFAKQKCADDIHAFTPTSTYRFFASGHFYFNTKEIILITLSVNVLFWFLWCLRMFTGSRKIASTFLVLSGIAMVTTAIVFLVQLNINKDLAVVTAPEVNVFTDPTEQSVVRFKIHAGTEAAVFAQNGEADQDWIRIQLVDGKLGWAKRNQFETVNNSYPHSDNDLL